MKWDELEVNLKQEGIIFQDIIKIFKYMYV